MSGDTGMERRDRTASAGEQPVVTVLSDPADSPWPGLEPLADEADVRHAADRRALLDSIPETDVLVVTDFRTDEVAEAWPRAERLRWVHATSAGVDQLLFDGLVDSDIPLTNARGVFSGAIAETVLGYMLAFCKDVHGSLRLQQQGRWRHRDTQRLKGKRLLVVGAGDIGRSIARLARAAGVEVFGTARSARDDDPDFAAVYAGHTLHDHLPEADFVVIAAPLTDATEGLFDRTAFRAMAEHARLLNIGRGPIVVTDDLVSALEAGELAGAYLDVVDPEPLPPDHPLWAMEQVLISAHMAGDFTGWREALSEQFMDNFRRWRSGDSLFNVVDKQRGYGPKQR